MTKFVLPLTFRQFIIGTLFVTMIGVFFGTWHMVDYFGQGLNYLIVIGTIVGWYYLIIIGILVLLALNIQVKIPWRFKREGEKK